MELSLILPAYNASESLRRHLPELMKVLQKGVNSFELIVVDDGSTENPDARSSLASFCHEFGCKLVVHTSNQGKGAAVRSGVEASQGKFILFTDTDIPFGYDSILHMFEELKRSGADVAMAERRESGYHASSSRRRSLGSKVFSLAVRLILWSDLGDTQCGLKGFRRESAEQIFPRSHINGFAADVEWLLLAKRANMRVIHVPVELHHQGISSVSLVKHSLPMIAEVIKLRFRR